MVYVIRYDTWTVEETDAHDIRDLKFNSELEAEEQILKELSDLSVKHVKDEDRFYYDHYEKHWVACLNRIHKLKQQ